MFVSPGPGDLDDICHSHALTMVGADSCWMSGQVWPPYHACLPHTVAAASPKLATPHPPTYPPTKIGQLPIQMKPPFLPHIGKWPFGHLGCHVASHFTSVWGASHGAPGTSLRMELLHLLPSTSKGHRYTNTHSASSGYVMRLEHLKDQKTY